MNEKELQEILDKHLKWLNGEEGSERANLRGADLRGVNLRGADLYRANLERVDLRGADLRRADLVGANLRRADLVGADLVGVNLRGANLRGADLRGANLGGADLYGANLCRADLHGADLENTSVLAFYLGKHFAFYHEGYLKIGCKGYLIEEWMERVREIGEVNGYSEEEIDLYKYFIKGIYLKTKDKKCI